MIKKIIEVIHQHQYREIRHIKNINKPIYYIIRRKSPGAGFFSNYFYVLSHIVYAEKNGWLPIIDMKNYPTLYSENYEYMGTNNAWEYYFKQPVDNLLEQVYHADNIIMSRNAYLGDQGVPVYTINQGHITNSMVKFLYPIQEKKISVLPYIQKEAQEMFRSFFGNSLCIGVHIRGTDMKLVQDAHTLPPNIERIIWEIEKLLENYSDAKIMLCCDENKAMNLICKKFGDRVKTTNAFRSKENSLKGVHMQTSNRKHHKYLLGKEVLLDCLMLSKCNFLICGISNVTSAAILFNNFHYRNIIVLK